MKDTAELLLHVIRVMDIKESRYIGKPELEEAGKHWAEGCLAHRIVHANKTSARRFTSAGRGYLRFRGLYAVPQLSLRCFESVFANFSDAVHNKMGYHRSTIAGIVPPIRKFLFWAAQRRDQISSISLRDIDDFLGEGRATGWRPRTVACQSQALRTFFRFAETRGWCRVGFARGIQNPRVRQCDRIVTGPSWKEVRRLIDTIDDSKSADCRAKAIVLLCSVYGLRNTEITRLILNDFDWYNETFAVKRAKRGRLQQFPIQYEVGQAIIRYLHTVRPQCACRNLFVTLVPPYRALGNLAPIIRKQMNNLGIISQTHGTHSLRHACATELLRKGTPLRNIADFLGHRDLRSVSIYAKYDSRSLRKVANFSLASVL